MSENLNGDKQPFPEINKVNHEPQIPSFRDGRKGSVVLQTMFRSVSNATTNAFNKISGNDQQEVVILFIYLFDFIYFKFHY